MKDLNKRNRFQKLDFVIATSVGQMVEISYYRFQNILVKNITKKLSDFLAT